MASEAETNDITLQCLGNVPADAGLLKRWRLFLALPPSARERIWDVLRPILARHSDEDIRDHALRLAQSHEIETENLAMALQACQALVSRASEINLDAENFGNDLLTLSGDSEQGPHARDVLLRGYGEACRELRQRLAHEAVLNHGKLATSVEWRIDRVMSSGQCRSIGMMLPILTVDYREGAREERITLQLSSEVILQLQQFCSMLTATESNVSDSPEGASASHQDV